MRIQYVLALSAISAALVACSSGGMGSATFGDSPPIGGSSGGATPALGPGGGGPTGGDDNPQTDSGTKVDTGSGGTDTGVKDTGSGGTDTGVSDVCSEPSSCPSDPAPTSTTIAQCRSLINGAKCPSQYKALFQCLADNRVCTSSGTTDSTATSEMCTSQQSALNTCASGG